MKVNIRLIAFLTIIWMLFAFSGNAAPKQGVKSEQDFQVDTSPAAKYAIKTMKCGDEAIDLETGKIFSVHYGTFDCYGLNSDCPVPEPPPGPPPAGLKLDFLFACFKGYPFIKHQPSPQQDAQIAYSEEPFENVNWIDLASLNFSPDLVDTPFDSESVAIIRTRDGNYFKLGFMSYEDQYVKFMYDPIKKLMLKPILRK